MVAALMLANTQSRAVHAAHEEMGRVLMALEDISEVGAERFLAGDSALNQSIRDWHSWAHRDAAPTRASGDQCVPMSCGSI